MCDLIPNVHTNLRIIVFQNAKEALHPKNSVRLLKLAFSRVEVVVVTSEVDVVTKLRQLDLSKWCLIYPCDHSMPLETMSENERETLEGFILIDATWRKAFAMYHTSEVFGRISTKHFLSPPNGNYVIRKTSKEKALSTFEACVYTLECLELSDLSSMRRFFLQAQTLQWRKMPSVSQMLS